MATLNPTVLKKLEEWRRSPLLFATECMHFQPSAQQAEYLMELAKSKRITIRSGHGTGKDAVVGGVGIPWFLTTRPYSKVVCTAPTARQLSDILWSEISKWLRQSAVGDEFVIQKDKIFHKDYPREWWCRAVSASAKATKEEQAETLAGFHGDHLLIVVDEASGVLDPVFIPLEGALTQEDNRVTLIGNMTRRTGYFYDSHFHPEISKDWTKLHWDSRKSTNVKPEFCIYMANKYGIDSNIFRIRVAGEPPLADDSVLIPLDWAEACIGQEIGVPEDEPIYLGVDVARYGDDDSVVLPRRGDMVLPWDSFNGLNTINLAGFVLNCYAEADAFGLAVDEIGVGAGVVDWLEKHNIPGLFGVNVSRASSDIKKFNRLRDELWLRVREKCLRQRYSFPLDKKPGDVLSMGQMLANELATPHYTFNGDGGYIVESKKDMKRRGIPSPNIADALCLSEYFSGIATMVFKDPKKIKASQARWQRIKNRQQGSLFGKDAWQVA